VLRGDKETERAQAALSAVIRKAIRWLALPGRGLGEDPLFKGLLCPSVRARTRRRFTDDLRAG